MTCGPNEALIISGMFQGSQGSLLTGGRAVVCPGIQTLQRIPLNTITLSVATRKVYTSQGVAVGVVGTAQVKINGANEEMLSFAAEQFGGKDQGDILSICIQVKTY